MKVLACTDGSEQSRKALQEAAEVAKSLSEAEVTVLLVEEPLSHKGDVGHYFSEDSLRQLQQRIEEDRKRIEAESREIFESRNVPFTFVIKEGHPAETISQVASREGYDMVVMGNRGLGGLDKVLLGSVSSAVVQEVKASVMIVK